MLASKNAPDNIGLSEMLIAGSAEALHAKPRKTLHCADIALLSEVSERLMHDSTSKRIPGVMSFAFWCRRSHLERIAKERADLSFNVGRGLALHITPSNVPVTFAFSWAFSLLAGNANIVRLPSKPFPQIDAICRAINAAMEHLDDNRSSFVRYPSESNITGHLSAFADVRFMWGGNQTIAAVKKLDSKPRCMDIAFADRFSLAIINPVAIDNLGDQELSALARSFYNDTYAMDQNACSSPMVVCWQKSETATAEAKLRFWKAVRAEAGKYVLQDGLVMDKYALLCQDAASGRTAKRTVFDGLLQVVDLDARSLIARPLSDLRGKGGYFYQIDESIEGLLPLLDQTCQTITYFGVDAGNIRQELVESGCRGIDRIVPIGAAMDIDITWDGMDLLSMASRRIDLR